MRFTPGAGTTPRKGFRPLPRNVDRDVLLRRGAELQARGRFEEAAREYRAAIARFPGFAEAYTNLGTLSQAQGQWDEAMAYYRKALALDPLDGRLHVNMGEGYKAWNRLEEATHHYRAAIQLFENNERHNREHRVGVEMCLAAALLTGGNFSEGLLHYEWRHRLPGLTPLYRDVRQPMWRGEPLDGTHLLAIAEQGIGDTLQFCRYLPLIREKADRVTVLVPELLRGLVSGIPGIAVVVGGDPLVPYDKYSPLMSLPHCLGTTLETIPANVPYLSVPMSERERAAAFPWPEGRPRVGVVWAGNANHPNDMGRSLPFGLLEPLFGLPEVRFVSFQLGREDERAAATRRGVVGPVLEPANLAYTAALLTHMDLVLTVDTAVAHLAGALGVPVWLMVPFVPDWRWLLGRDDSPWYPQTRIFRQKRPGEWAGVLYEVRTALLDWSG